MQAFDGADERFAGTISCAWTPDFIRVQPIRALARRTLRENLRWWANKSSPGGKRIPNTVKLRPTIGEMDSGIARTVFMPGAATDQRARRGEPASNRDT
jgi:hypothetical protein